MPSKHKLVIIVVIATIFGLFSGVVGSIVARVYILEDAFNVPLFGELSFKEQQAGSSIVIRNAKKVVVEQNVKIDEVARSSRESLVRIYKRIRRETKKGEEKDDIVFNIENYYRADSFLSQGFILTSDGWMVTEFLPKDIAVLLKGVKSTSSKLALDKALEDFVVLDKNENQYKVLLVVHDVVSGFTYWKINASGLPVKKFGLYNEISSGQIILAINSKNQIWLTSISGIIDDEKELEYSDLFDPKLVLNEKVEESFFSSFLFDLNGNILGVIDGLGVAKPISSFVACINCLLEDNVISRPAFGVYYIDLAKYILDESALVKKGALIARNEKGASFDPLAPAKIAGLKEGDIIISVDGQEIDRENSLAYVIANHKIGDKVVVEYIRQGKFVQVDVVLEKK